MKVVVAPWLQNGTVSDTTSFYKMWDTVINKYGGNSNFYFDIMNEPYDLAPQINQLRSRLAGTLPQRAPGPGDGSGYW